MLLFLLLRCCWLLLLQLVRVQLISSNLCNASGSYGSDVDTEVLHPITCNTATVMRRDAAANNRDNNNHNSTPAACQI